MPLNTTVPGSSLNSFQNWANSLNGDGTKYLNDNGQFATPSGGSLGYLVYVAILNHTVEGVAPVATVLQNTVGSITWAAAGGQGSFNATVAGGFNIAKTVMWFQCSFAYNGNLYFALAEVVPPGNGADSGKIFLSTKAANTAPVDDWGAPISCEIRIYP